MAIYAIGDVHGCYRELRKLLAKLPIDWDRDRLWMVGDLVNRGPDSLRVLRWARRTSKEMGKRFRVVLGNHDLRLLALAEGWIEPKSWDTAVDILESRHREKLIRWLRRQPLLYRRGDYLLVHGGLWPQWTADKAETWARRVETAIGNRKKRSRQLLDPSVDRDETSPSTAKLHYALEAFTRLRSCTRKGSPCNHSGPPSTLPKNCVPWFEVPDRRSADVTVICGHWSALGLRIQEGLVAIDTACVWGGSLTAVRLDEPTVYSQPAL